MDRNKEIAPQLDYSLLRNPFVICGFVIVSILPEMLIFCFPIESALSGVSSCSKELVNESLIQNSFLSSTVVFLSFETQRIYNQKRNLLIVPQGIKSWLGIQPNLVIIALIAFVIFCLLRFIVYSITGTPLSSAQVLSLGECFKVWFIVSISYFGLVLAAHRRAKRNYTENTIYAGENMDQAVELADIRYFQKSGKKYFLQTFDNRIPINLTLKELELILPKGKFKRINRAIIANLSQVASYNYWEHEKYILKMKTDEEFVVTRKRLNEIKPLL